MVLAYGLYYPDCQCLGCYPKRVERGGEKDIRYHRRRYSDYYPFHHIGRFCTDVGYVNDNEEENRKRIKHETNKQEVRCQISLRSEEHTSELQSLMRISYAVFCLNTKTT